MLTQSRLKELLHYDVNTGIFTRIKRRNGCKLNKRAGNLNDNGYRCICIDYKFYREHRLAWLYVHGDWPNGNIDHENHVRDDNRFSNLRIIYGNGNEKNQKTPVNNTSGLMGVYWFKRNSKWQVEIQCNKKRQRLGQYNDFFEACCVRKSAEVRLGFHENHGR